MNFKDNQQRAILEQKLDFIEEKFLQCRSTNSFDQTLIDEFNSTLDLVLDIPSDNSFLNWIINRRPQIFDYFQFVAIQFFLQRSFNSEQLNYLTRMGFVHRRLTLTLQNDNDFIDDDENETERMENNLEHQKRVRYLLFDLDENLFEYLIEILPTICQDEIDVIEMILPWYEALIYFEHSYIDSTLDEYFQRFNQQIIQCLRSNEYERSLLIVENQTSMIISVRHRFYLGVCTMSMGVHVNCDTNECEESRELLEFYLSRYIDFIHLFSRENFDNSTKILPCLTGIVTFLVNYTLTIDNEQNRQLLIDLFLLIVSENFYLNIRLNWSTYETILFDSIICYLIVYCHSDRLIIDEILSNNIDFIVSFEKLIEHSERVGNCRIAILSQLLLLILISKEKNENLSSQLFSSSLSYIDMALNNSSSYHYNRIPISMFLKSLIHIVKFDHIQQDIFTNDLWKIFVDLIVKFNDNRQEFNEICRESTTITLNILWSISFHEQIKKRLKQSGEIFFRILEQINGQTDDLTVKQMICGLFFNLDRLTFTRKSFTQSSNFGKTIGISYDPSDSSVVQMIEHELNRLGHRVWTSYDEMFGEFLPSFAAMMQKTKYLIVCLSEMYRWNNRCRAEVHYATSEGHQVLSWKIHRSTGNIDQDEEIRQRNLQILFSRISSNDDETGQVRIEFRPRSTSNLSEMRRFRPPANPNNWTNAQVVHWCQQMNFVAFEKLLKRHDGQGLMKLYQFCKNNSPETISVLNNDLIHLCEEENLSAIVLSVNEYIQFQVELEKFLLSSNNENRSTRKRFKWKFCQIL